MKKENKEIIYSISSLLAVIIILIFLFKAISIPSDTADRTQCPYKIEGNANSSLVVKYVDSPYCMWCWFEEGVLKEMVATKGDLFKLEKYDIRYCDEIAKYGFSGTPSFVFSLDKGEKEYTHYGFISEEKFNAIICEVTGDC